MDEQENVISLMRKRFIARCRDQLAILKAAHKGDESLLKTVHSLAGAGGVFGSPEISARAGDLETLLIAQAPADADEKAPALQALIREIEARLA